MENEHLTKYKVDQITLKKNKKDYSAKITADGRPAGGVYFQAENVPVAAGQNDYSVTVTDTGAGTFKQTATSQHSFTVTDLENIGKFDGSYNYDIRGQMTNLLENLSKVKYVHDKLGRLTEIHGLDFERYYVYDSMNRRLQSTEIDKNLASPTVVVTNERHFVYDGMNVIAELKIENSKLQIEKCYVRGAGLGGGIGDIISIINCQLSIINYLHYNHRGDVVLTTDETGQEESKYSYTAFGKLTANSLPLTANYFIGFSSKEYDEKTGLIYFGFRYYDPELGRWLKFDPAKEDGNYYVFALNNPIRGVEYYGLLTIKDFTQPFIGNESWFDILNYSEKSRSIIAKHNSTLVPYNGGWHSQKNDNKYGHANQTAQAQKDFGILGAPLIPITGIGYEIKTFFAAGHTPNGQGGEGLFDGQHFVNWAYDTPGDMVANLYGQVAGLIDSLTLGYISYSELNKMTLLIPGPNYSTVTKASQYKELAIPGIGNPFATTGNNGSCY